MSDTENLIHRSTFMASIASSLCVIVATLVLASITSSELRGWDFVHAHTQLSCVYLDVTHVIKCTRVSLILVGRG